MTTNNSAYDVHVFARDTLDKPSDFTFPWLVQFADGTITGYSTENEACKFQRAWRVQHGRDPMTGEARKAGVK